MKLSIITVCFNSAPYIADALKSIDQQSWSNIEHLVIDGASTDDTLEIAAMHAKPWRSVFSEADRGIYDAMNKGLRKATGDWIGFLNADDIYDSPNAVESIALAIQSHPDANVVYGDLVYVKSDDTCKALRYWQSGAFTRSRLKFGWMPPHPTFFVPRTRIEELGTFNADLRIAADYDFMLRYLNREDACAAYLPKVIVRMRAGGASNRSINAMVHKSREDLLSIRSAGLSGWPTLICKNLRKVPQFFKRPGPPCSGCTNL